MRARNLIASVMLVTSLAVPVAPTAAEAHPACPRYEHLLRVYRLPVAVFSRIMFRESGCQAGARNVNRNGTVDRGLLQINSVHLDDGGAADGYARAQLYIPEINVKIAARLYKRSGMNPWR